MHITFEIEKETFNYIEGTFFFENKVIIWKEIFFLLSKRSGHFKAFHNFC